MQRAGVCAALRTGHHASDQRRHLPDFRRISPREYPGTATGKTDSGASEKRDRKNNSKKL